MREPAGAAVPPLGAIQAQLETQIPQLYRELALYLQVLREVLPSSLDQACAHLATQVHPRRYNRLPQRARRRLHARLKTLLTSCCSLLTVEQLQSLASQMARERQRLALGEQAGLAPHSWHQNTPHSADGEALEEDDEGEETTRSSSRRGDVLPSGSIQLNLTPPLTGSPFGWPQGLIAPPADPPSSEDPRGSPLDSEDDGEPSAWTALVTDGLSAAGEAPSSAASLWSSGQLPRDPVLLIHWLEGWEVALSRRLRNLSHSVNLELARVGLLPAVLPVRLLDSVLSGQIESQGSPANLLRLPIPPQEAGRALQAPLGVLLRTVDLEMEQPRLRTCRRRLLHRRQEVLKMAETFHRLQRRLQAQHAERLWRHDSQLNHPRGM